MPQVHGASRDVLRYVTQVIETEINAVTDNPLLFPDEDLILSGGNFHGQPVAMALDFLAIASAEIGSIAETRIEKLINPSFSDLPAFLTKNGGLNSGFMIVQVAAASIVSENKTLCHPASVDSIPTSADKEDHVSMGAWGAVKLSRVLNNIRRVLAIELMMGCQGLDFHAPLKTSESLEKVRSIVRSRVAFAEEDRFFHPDLVALEEILKNHEIPVFES
jgi:histidine ammonia-lyase